MAPRREAVLRFGSTRGVCLCPRCNFSHSLFKTRQSPRTRKSRLTLVVHPDWLAATAKTDSEGAIRTAARRRIMPSLPASVEQKRRASRKSNFTRGSRVTCPINCVRAPETKASRSHLQLPVAQFPEHSHYTCGKCGTVRCLQKGPSKASGKTAPHGSKYSPGICARLIDRSRCSIQRTPSSGPYDRCAWLISMKRRWRN